MREPGVGARKKKVEELQTGHLYYVPLGSLHKLRLHFLAFDHASTPPSFYVVNLAIF